MRRFFILFWRLGRRDLRLLWYALRHPQRPGWLLPASILLLLFALEPLNFAILPLGLADELVVLPLVLHSLLRWLPPSIQAGFAGQASRAADMIDPVEPLVIDLLEWIGPAEGRPYSDVMDAWRTSCPRLPVWEEANARGFIDRRGAISDRGAVVALSELGKAWLADRRVR